MSYGLLTSISANDNLVENGGFEVWQRGTTFNSIANGAFSADRFIASYNGTPTLNITKETTIVDVGSIASLKLVVTAVGGSTIFALQQNIENYLFYAGKTLSYSVRVNSNVACYIGMGDGVGSATYSSAHSGNSTWQTLTITRTIASVPTNLQVYFGFSGGTGVPVISTSYLDNAMLVIGGQPVNFVSMNAQTDLARCRRYFWRFGGNLSTEAITGGMCINASQALLVFHHPGMRAAPAWSFTGGTLIRLTLNSSSQVLTTANALNFGGNDASEILSSVSTGLAAGDATVIWTSTTGAFIDATSDI